MRSFQIRTTNPKRDCRDCRKKGRRGGDIASNLGVREREKTAKLSLNDNGGKGGFRRTGNRVETIVRHAVGVAGQKRERGDKKKGQVKERSIRERGNEAQGGKRARDTQCR